MLNNRAGGTVLRDCLRAPLAGGIVRGSDFPVPCFGVWAWLMGYLGARAFWKWQRHPNPVERDYQLKRAIGFPPETFTRIDQLLRSVKKVEKPARESRE